MHGLPEVRRRSHGEEGLGRPFHAREMHSKRRESYNCYQNPTMFVNVNLSALLMSNDDILSIAEDDSSLKSREP